MKDSSRDHRFLRGAQRANALFSALSGLVLVILGRGLAEPLGLAWPWLVGTGLLLLFFAADVWLQSRRRPIARGRAWTVVGMDAGWVLGSVWLLVSPPAGLTSAGWWTIAVVADVVALFALLQGLGLRRGDSRREARIA